MHIIVPGSSIENISINPGSQHVLTSCSSGAFYVYPSISVLESLPASERKPIFQRKDFDSSCFLALWNNDGTYLVAGSVHGSARVYSYDNLTADLSVYKILRPTFEKLGPGALSLNCSVWTCFSGFAVCGFSFETSDDFKDNFHFLMVYETRSNEIRHSIQLVAESSPYFSNVVSQMDAHPKVDSLIFWADYSGKIILWDVEFGIKLKVFREVNEHLIEGPPRLNMAILDGKFSPDGRSLVVSTYFGSITIYSCFNDDVIECAPREQFFQKDYSPFHVDREKHFVVSEDTQRLSHLEPLGPICSSKGILVETLTRKILANAQAKKTMLILEEGPNDRKTSSRSQPQPTFDDYIKALLEKTKDIWTESLSIELPESIEFEADHEKIFKSVLRDRLQKFYELSSWGKGIKLLEKRPAPPAIVLEEETRQISPNGRQAMRRGRPRNNETRQRVRGGNGSRRRITNENGRRRLQSPFEEQDFNANPLGFDDTEDDDYCTDNDSSFKNKKKKEKKNKRSGKRSNGRESGSFDEEDQRTIRNTRRNTDSNGNLHQRRRNLVSEDEEGTPRNSKENQKNLLKKRKGPQGVQFLYAVSDPDDQEGSAVIERIPSGIGSGPGYHQGYKMESYLSGRNPKMNRSFSLEREIDQGERWDNRQIDSNLGRAPFKRSLGSSNNMINLTTGNQQKQQITLHSDDENQLPGPCGFEMPLIVNKPPFEDFSFPVQNGMKRGPFEHEAGYSFSSLNSPYQTNPVMIPPISGNYFQGDTSKDYLSFSTINSHLPRCARCSLLVSNMVPGNKRKCISCSLIACSENCASKRGYISYSDFQCWKCWQSNETKLLKNIDSPKIWCEREWISESRLLQLGAPCAYIPQAHENFLKMCGFVTAQDEFLMPSESVLFHARDNGVVKCEIIKIDLKIPMRHRGSLKNSPILAILKLRVLSSPNETFSITWYNQTTVPNNRFLIELTTWEAACDWWSQPIDQMSLGKATKVPKASFMDD